MFSAVMRPNPSTWPIVALLLAFLLPLQGFAAISGCAQPTPAQYARHQTRIAHEHCAEHPAQDSAVQHHGCCSDCCMAAMAQATPDWTPPRAETPQLSLPALRTPLMICLDRLDRPPRTQAS
jgi:hypothetical protein